MQILPDHAYLDYCGRIDFDDPKAPFFIYAGSFVRIKFTGTALRVRLANRRAYFTAYIGYLLDGVQGKFALADDDAAHDYQIAEALSEGEHELLLFKRMDGCHYFSFLGLTLSENGKLLAPAKKPKRRLEVFGDSVSCGEVSEAVEYVGKEDPKHDGEFSNSRYSYSWLTAGKLGAELHITAQGGAALLDRTGWFCGPDFVGMESIYDKLQYNPQLGGTKKWDFEIWKPHVAVIAIGQNDANPEDYMKEAYDGEKALYWRKEYRAFLEKLMTLYPKAQFILTTTILGHDESWDRAIEEVCQAMNSPRVHHFLYEKNGCGTPGHIRIPEAEKMAEELSAFINSLGEEIWNE